MKSFVFEGITDHDYYTSRGWKENCVSLSREYDVVVPGLLIGRCRQYGLKHHVTSVHSRQGDTLHKIATEINLPNKHYILWDKGQVVVSLSSAKMVLMSYLSVIKMKSSIL